MYPATSSGPACGTHVTYWGLRRTSVRYDILDHRVAMTAHNISRHSVRSRDSDTADLKRSKEK
jgi:hypothetical protein